ncbi:TetR/AcrR family transcriptional regulator [Luteimonas sp. e5]
MNANTPVAGRKTPRRRRAGRPEAGGVDLREKLLDATLACFARSGVAGTALRTIAQQAGVTPAMLHYYFGDKPALVEALVAERLLPAMAALRKSLEQVQGQDDPRALAVAFVRGMMQVIAANPWLPPLWVREVLTEGGAFRELLVKDIGPNVTQQLVARFSAMQREGRLPAGLDPALLVASLVGLTLFPAAGLPVWSRVLDAGSLGTREIEAHAIALLEGALRPEATP